MTQTDLSDYDTDLTGADDSPIGKTFDGHPHFAHVRYAATDDPGVIWYDPRDGREDYSLGHDPELADFESDDDRIRLRAKIRPFRPESHGDPAARYVVKESFAYVETFEQFSPGEDVEIIRRVGTCGSSDVFDSLDAARDYLRETVAGYADAPRRDAVAARTGV